MSLRSADGRERVAVSLDDHGPTLVFVQGGNIALQLGVDDPALPGDHNGAYLTIADGDGEPLLRLWVGPGGSLRVEASGGDPG